jgi:hypothetical protein
MAYDKFLIAPFESGLETDRRPWQIPEDAFSTLENAYVFRGRVRKRFGSSLTGTGATSSQTAPLYSRVSALVGTTNGSGALSGTVPGKAFSIGQAFSIGDEIFTVNATGTPATMLTTGTSSTCTFNTTTGAYVFAGSALSTAVYFYPATPIMGLTTYETEAVVNNTAFAFDTQFAYKYSGGSWVRDGSKVWHGSDSQFFWTCNWQGANTSTVEMFVTNFNATKNATPGANDDPMYSYDPTAGWAVFKPRFNVAGDFVQSCRIIIPFKDRLVLLNTIEQDVGNVKNTHFQARCRYSHNGTPIPDNTNGSWLEHNEVGWNGAGWIDAATQEEIISAEFIKDRLIVYFERSTWELAYTGNQIQPFVWQKINTELGADSTFSSVPFDKFILTVGNVGVHSCTGGNVERIDAKIPQQIFNVNNGNGGLYRIQGIRDYFTEMVYWSFPQQGSNKYSSTYPNKVLVYNYKNDSWSINDDSITCFGYFEQQDDQTWATSTFTWGESSQTWGSGIIDAQARRIIFGNQQGYILYVTPDNPRNAPSLQITDIVAIGTDTQLTIPNHSLQPGEYIYIENGLQVGPATLALSSTIYQVGLIIDANTVSIGTVTLPAKYLGGATAARVSNMLIESKQWNPYISKAQDVSIGKIDFGVQKTDNGQVYVDYSPSASNISMITDSTGSSAILGNNNILETTAYPDIPLEVTQERLWHTIYFQGQGECIQIKITMNPAQITDPKIAFSDFQLEGILLYTNPTGRLQ